MANHLKSKISVYWKPLHMINEGDFYPTRSKVTLKTTSAYARWWGMFCRCYKTTDPGYCLYGAKGVTVSVVWGNFQNFAKWYYDNCTFLGIDPENNQYDLDKDTTNGFKEYGPDTCKLVPVSENVAKATSKTHLFISPNGEEVQIFNLSKFCRENGLSRRQMNRLKNGTCKNHNGWRLA